MPEVNVLEYSKFDNADHIEMVARQNEMKLLCAQIISINLNQPE